jgi:hypothetical protein
MQTIVHVYSYDISKEQDRLAYEALCAKLADVLPRRMVSWGGDSHYKTGLDGVTVTLEDKFLFNNQWNAHDAGGKQYRLFDWAEDYMRDGSKIKRGHWLEITPQMTAIRNEISVCGYCGAYEPTVTHGGKFCPHCLDSEYLTEDSLHLTRMHPVSETVPVRRLPMRRKRNCCRSSFMRRFTACQNAARNESPKNGKRS